MPSAWTAAAAGRNEQGRARAFSFVSLSGSSRVQWRLEVCDLTSIWTWTLAARGAMQLFEQRGLSR